MWNQRAISEFDRNRFQLIVKNGLIPPVFQAEYTFSALVSWFLTTQFRAPLSQLEQDNEMRHPPACPLKTSLLWDKKNPCLKWKFHRGAPTGKKCVKRWDRCEKRGEKMGEKMDEKVGEKVGENRTKTARK